jgi:exodeoxyribonuclease-3
LQETKVTDEQFPAEWLRSSGYPHLAFQGQKGYNGVAIASRLPIARHRAKKWCGRADCRHIYAALPGGVEVHNVYVPAGGDVPDPLRNEKFAHKLQFLTEMTQWFRRRRKSDGRLVLVGDLNVAPHENDVWSHERLVRVVTHTPVEVEALERLRRSHDWVDAVRHFVPTSEKLYSWWSYRTPEWRKANKGRRLDHIWVTPALAPRLIHARVVKAMRGWTKPSDHVPVVVDMDVTGCS